MSLRKVIQLTSGKVIPQIGLGTWMSKPGEVEFAVESAVKHGYRHLDLAHIYENQNEVRAALKKVIPSVVEREDLFITSKLWNGAHQPAQVPKELDITLTDLGLEYLDMYLIHWPVAFAPESGLYPPDEANPGWVKLDLETTLVDTWKAMLALPKEKVRHVGVSNFGLKELKGIIAATGVVPAVNQVEAHPHLQQDELLAFCKEKGIHVTAYSPLGNNLVGKPKLTEHAIVKEIAERLDATPAQVLVAWGAYRGYSVIPKSVQESRIVSNFKQIELSAEDYEKITTIGKETYTRFNIPHHYTPRWDIDIFGEPEEQTAKNKTNIGA